MGVYINYVKIVWLPQLHNLQPSRWSTSPSNLCRLTTVIYSLGLEQWHRQLLLEAGIASIVGLCWQFKNYPLAVDFHQSFDLKTPEFVIWRCSKKTNKTNIYIYIVSGKQWWNNTYFHFLKRDFAKKPIQWHVAQGARNFWWSSHHYWFKAEKLMGPAAGPGCTPPIQHWL